jgi:molybdopterin synthase sulfurtransferase
MDRRRHLVTPAWLAALLAGRDVPGAPGQGWRVIEVAHDGAADFESGHVPGAGYLDTRELERGLAWTKVADRKLLDVLRRHGIRHDTPVILYGRNNLAAARAAHLMLYAGVRDVRLLDGGYALWTAGRNPIDAGPARAAVAACGFGARFPANPHYLLNTQGVAELLGQGRDAVVASIRTWNEHVGLCSGYPYIVAKGDIPGARWARAGRNGDVNSMSEYQEADGTMRPASVIQALWARVGIHRDVRTAFYCGTGWRASLAFFCAWLMGGSGSASTTVDGAPGARSANSPRTAWVDGFDGGTRELASPARSIGR